jgi:hypothetical protein
VSVLFKPADTPFHRLKPSTAANMPRGFHRYALKVVGNMLVKSASVMDNNNFILLATSDISGVAADGARMMPRNMPGCATPQLFNTFDELDTYLLNFNGADMLDRGVAEYTTQMRAVRYYIRVFWWHVDLANFTCWQYIQPHIIGEPSRGRGVACAPARVCQRLEQRWRPHALYAGPCARRHPVRRCAAPQRAAAPDDCRPCPVPPGVRSERPAARPLRRVRVSCPAADAGPFAGRVPQDGEHDERVLLRVPRNLRPHVP